MRAKTLWQPWATLVVAGQKPIENRPQPVPSTLELPVRIGIHAAKRIDDDAFYRTSLRTLMVQPRGYELTTDPDDMPTGALIGFATITDCHHADQCWRRNFETAARGGLCSRWAHTGAYHYVIEDPVQIDPVPVRGYQGWWTLPDELADLDAA